jgi:hypothetical protein
MGVDAEEKISSNSLELKISGKRVSFFLGGMKKSATVN